MYTHTYMSTIIVNSVKEAYSWFSTFRHANIFIKKLIVFTNFRF